MKSRRRNSMSNYKKINCDRHEIVERGQTSVASLETKSKSSTSLNDLCWVGRGDGPSLYIHTQRIHIHFTLCSNRVLSLSFCLCIPLTVFVVVVFELFFYFSNIHASCFVCFCFAFSFFRSVLLFRSIVRSLTRLLVYWFTVCACVCISSSIYCACVCIIYVFDLI